MKKIISVFCLLAMMLSMLVACNDHEHAFSAEEWAKDADYHWRPCTAKEGCNEKNEKAEHEFEVIVNAEGKAINVCKVCGESNDRVSAAPEHEHVYADELSHSENFHWYACTIENCYEMKDKKEHAFGNPDVTYEDAKITIKEVCVDCAYEKVEEQTVKTEVDDALSWNEAFKNFKLTNFTMDVFMQREDETQNNHCVVTETEAYYHIEGGMEFYTVPNGDGTYTTYMRQDEDTPFHVSNKTSDMYLKGAQVETVIQVSFEENFDKFTYDEKTASYVCKDVIEAECFNFSGSLQRKLYCYDNIVKMTDGKISYIESKYYFDTEDDTAYSFKYYNIGMSAVKIPQSVIDTAIPEETVTDRVPVPES